MSGVPASSHGGGGPAAGAYLPVSGQGGAPVLDTTTYDDLIWNSGKLATLVFPHDAQVALALAISGDAFPRIILTDSPHNGWYFGPGNIEPVNNGMNFATVSSGGADYLSANALATYASAAPGLNQLSPRFTITSGALPTVALSSGTGAQLSTTRDAEAFTPVTFNPTAGAAATCLVGLSPDNVTYSALGTETEPAGVALDGTIHLIRVRVPAAWFLKLTVVNATLGTTTYY